MRIINDISYFIFVQDEPQNAYPQTEFIICPSNVQGITKENWFNTKDGIDKVMDELMRCGSQFKDVLSASIQT